MASSTYLWTRQEPGGTATEQLFYTTARLQYVISPPDAGDASRLLIEGPAAIENTDQPLLGQRAVIEVLNPPYVAHPDSDIDVAVIDGEGFLLKTEHPMFVKPFPFHYLTNTSELDTLDAIEQVTFVGYPNGMYDSANLTPIARRGWTATLVSLDYDGKPVFLIDASVFPGSSGSPVLIVNQGSYTRRSGETILTKHRVILLGIISTVYLQETTGELVSALHHPQVRVNQMIDLGMVYKTRTILEAVDQFLVAKGLVRAESPSTDSTSSNVPATSSSIATTPPIRIT